MSWPEAIAQALAIISPRGNAYFNEIFMGVFCQFVISSCGETACFAMENGPLPKLRFQNRRGKLPL